MLQNVSGRKQCVYNQYQVYNTIHNNEVISEAIYPEAKNLSRAFKRITKLDLTEYDSILFKRTHALGDVIMLLPIVNYLRKLGKIVCIHTSSRFTIDGVNCIAGHPRFDYGNFDLVVDMTGIVEQDHQDASLYSKNRVDIYKDYLGLGNIGNDWSIDFPQKEIDIEGATIGIQVSGSTDYKSVNLVPLMKNLDSKGIKFFIIDTKNTSYNYKNSVSKRTDKLGLLNIMHSLKGVLCFDSGPFWLTHVTNTAAFVVVGPTSGSKLIVRHPNSKTMFFDTKEDYKCNSSVNGCGESAKDCNKRYLCLKNTNQKRLIKEFNKWIERL